MVKLEIVKACRGPKGRWLKRGEEISLSKNRARAFISSGRAKEATEPKKRKVSGPSSTKPAGPSSTKSDTPTVPRSEPDVIQCPHCDREYKTDKGLTAHLEAVHPDEE